MQLSRFSNGGFVLHKITGNFVGRISAWFDVNGKPIDAEQITSKFGHNRTRPVNRDGSIWQYLETLGNLYKHTPAF